MSLQRGSNAGMRGGAWARRGARCAAMAALWAIAAAPAAAAEPMAVAGFGVFGPEPGENRAAVVEIEYRFRPWRFGFAPVIGGTTTSDGGAYVRAGVGRDFPFAERWNANLSLAAAGYEAGRGKDLGLGLEFRSAIDLSYRVRPGVRLGLALAHLSNAGLSEKNPGAETLTMTVSFSPASWRRR